MYCPNLEIKETKVKGRGLYAKINIPSGAMILLAEEKNFITYSRFADHPVLQSILDKTDQKIVEFAYFLAYIERQHQRKGSVSAIQQYLQTLPQYYHNLICWSDKQLEELANPQLVRRIKQKKEKIRFAFNQISSFILKQQRYSSQRLRESPKKKGFNPKRGSRKGAVSEPEPEEQSRYQEMQILKRITLQDVTKYISAVESRNAYFPNQYDNNSAVGAMIPQLELFNHSRSSKCKVEIADKSYRVVAVQEIHQGEEVCVNYGTFNVEEFLQFYGMIPEEDGKQNDIMMDEVNKSQQRLKAGDLKRKIEQERSWLIKKYNKSGVKHGSRMNNILNYEMPSYVK